MFKIRFLLSAWIICIGCFYNVIASANDKVTVILDWFLNASHESLLAAQYSGAFQKYGLDVELIAPADPSAPPRLVAAGQADMAISYPIQLAMMVDQHIPLVQVGSLLNQPMDVLITNGNIKSIKDLKGKKIGVAIAGDQQAVLGSMLKSAGLSMSDVQLINVNFQLEQALMTGSVDAVIGATRNYELIDLQQRKVPVSYFYPEQYGVPNYDELIFVARPDKAKDPKVARFMAALKEGGEYLKAHPDEVFNKAIKDHPELNAPLNKAAWQVTLPLVIQDPGKIDQPKIQNFIDYLVKKKVIKQQHPFSDYAMQVKE
ncbi:ABC-type nitrate/sulfonate/bicarbonate transport system [Commensalibacter communis]|uniref:ABC transporter substrate-binding protein n=1 Tax=Commensalibacter communis TaxID=2972786 RepID=UPI0022FF687D|nr:ABC transporter substrate-binding protein [Commensalibacter communis]CAI3951663.1 ABC-type nitrate/sulfonate/bicarbonate transport system [Commensalibacter communis]CAI3952763.1 ABC-type nitrate/sulfonate/bicarbonate transport system [Commensalibacter communis]